VIKSVLSAAAVAVTSVMVAAVVTVGVATAATAVEEDEPGWDCRTMGNHVCGVIGVDDTPFNVHYDASGVVDWVEYTPFVPTPPPGCVSGYRGDPGEDPTVVRCDFVLV